MIGWIIPTYVPKHITPLKRFNHIIILNGIYPPPQSQFTYRLHTCVPKCKGINRWTSKMEGFAPCADRFERFQLADSNRAVPSWTTIAQNRVEGFVRSSYFKRVLSAIPYSALLYTAERLIEWPIQSLSVVGATGFEPATSASQMPRSTKLSHAPFCKAQPLPQEVFLEFPSFIKSTNWRASKRAGKKLASIFGHQ